MKIGTIFAPTTIEDIDQGGAEFIRLAENSRPSLMKKNANGKTISNLVICINPHTKIILLMNMDGR